ncbi:LuxR C-terminal-related transcriptional regulator [Streptomyces sp. NPDC057757]|uniref:LuxR C-terminal-related transcriptional regulator n=1 Tax=Streptomyces sp. NPDC057757 TaxID=3346241 RepID=UPI00369F98FA
MTIPVPSPVKNSRPSAPRPPIAFPADMVGRDGEVTALSALLADPSVPGVLLTGVPGAGKTRLAAETAAAYCASTGATAVRVEASAEPSTNSTDSTDSSNTTDSALALLATLTADGNAGGVRPLLLVDDLDRSDHHWLLRACAVASVVVLGTARQAPAAHGLVPFPVDPLPVPLDCSALDLGALARVPSVQLYLACLRTINPAFSLQLHNQQVIARTCVEVGGNPGALCRTARVAALESPEVAWASLGDRTVPHPVPHAVPHSAPAEDGTPSAAPGGAPRGAHPWPTDEAPTRLLTHCQVFSGGFGPEALRHITATGPEEFSSALETLLRGHLLTASTLPSGRLDGTARFRLRLPPDGPSRRLPPPEDTAARLAHARYYADLARAAADRIVSGHQRSGLIAFWSEERNLRTALETLLRHGRTGEALDLVDGIRVYWRVTGGWTTWAEGRPLPDPSWNPAGHRDRIRTDLLLAEAGILAGQPEAATDLLDRITADAAQAAGLSARVTRLRALCVLAADPGRGAALLDGAAGRHRSDGDRHEARYVSLEAALARFRLGDTVAAAATALEVLAAAQQGRDTLAAGAALLHLAVFAAAEGRAQATAHYCERALSALRALGPTAVLGAIATTLGSPALPDVVERAIGTARGLGAFHTWRGAFPEDAGTPDFAMARLEEPVRELLGEAVFARALVEGSRASLPDLLASIVPAPALPVAAPAEPPAPDTRTRIGPLTPRQTEVSRLVAAGLSNRQIAHRLAISEWTVVNHIRDTMKKLGCSSRVEIAGWMHHSGLRPSPEQPLFLRTALPPSTPTLSGPTLIPS